MSLITSILTGGVNNHETTAEEANALATDFISEGIVGAIANTSGVAPATGGFAVNATGTPDTNIQISAGTAYVTATPSTQGSQTIRVKNSATITQAISANSSGSTKYDWVYLSVDATNANAPNTAGDNVASITVSRSSSAASDDGTPPTYAILLAVVTVANGFSTITNSVIRDSRTRCTVGATAESPETYWVTGGLPAVSSVTENGNRSANITFASTVASILTPGMRIRTSRTVAAPTQCADLEASSSQYFNDTSVSGVTFTDDFCVGAWIKVESYANEAIMTRYNGTSGWALYLNSSGQVKLEGYNAGAANASGITSYQSVPLGKWVHITAQLDMSSFTATTTTSYIMIDGVDVPASVSRAGTNPTALVQAGNLEVGSSNGGTIPFDGKIAQVWVSSAKVTQANVKKIMSEGITTADCSTYSLASAYSLSNSLNDLNTTSANNLTAQGGALATNADSPFTTDANGTPGGTYDYAIVTKVATTVATVQYPEGCAIPTSGGISTVDYSGSNAFGFPKEEDRWELLYINKSQASHTSPTSAVWYSLTAATVQGSAYLTVPVGKWVLGYDGTFQLNATAGSLNIFATLSTANNSESDPMYTSYAENSSVAIIGSSFYKRRALPSAITTATPYYLNTRITAGSTPSIYNRGDIKPTIIFAIPAYL